MCVCVSVCARACVCVRMRACVCVIYIIYLQCCHFSVLNDVDGYAYGCGQCGSAADSPRFDHIFYFLANGFCHTSVTNTFRASVPRSAKKFRLRGMCSY